MATAASAPAGGGWHGRLELRYRLDGARTAAHDRHDGPLRVLRCLYPEGDAVAHHVLVHPPGGIVGGDRLDVQVDVEPGAHALLTTPSATRFYRSTGATATQSVVARVHDGARLEWLPLETLAHDGCVGENRLRFELAPGAEMMGWDLLALGLPAAGGHWRDGRFLQHLELPGRWLERARIDAADRRLLDSPLGWAGRSVLATAWIAIDPAGPPARVDALRDGARAVVDAHADAPLVSGVTQPHEGIVVLRALADRVEPVMALLQAVRACWRDTAWGLAANAPRVWST